MNSDIGFVVIYRWRVRQGQEGIFRTAWEELTLALKQERAALGSRLHRAEDGSWVAYAQWPDKAAWERSRSQDSPRPEASAALSGALLQSEDPLLLEPVCDHLAPGDQTR